MGCKGQAVAAAAAAGPHINAEPASWDYADLPHILQVRFETQQEGLQCGRQGTQGQLATSTKLPRLSCGGLQ
jgi:hypothetical protein